MNAFCVICSDHFVSLTEIDVSAGICGHTFHAACLEKWLHTRQTCPSCRHPLSERDVVAKLYFETSKSDFTEEESASKLLNFVCTRARLAESERKSSKLDDDCQALRVMVDAMNKQLKFYQSRDNERKELKKKVREYSYIESFWKVSETWSQLLLNKAAEGPGAVDRLVDMCARIKREYEHCKSTEKYQRNQLVKAMTELWSLRVELDKLKNDNVVFREQNERAEKELTESERQLLEIKEIFNSLPQSSSPLLRCRNCRKSRQKKLPQDFSLSSALSDPPIKERLRSFRGPHVVHSISSTKHSSNFEEATPETQ